MPLATIQDSVREYAQNAGMDNPTQEWILSPFDSWERNPFYTGVRHVDPETAGEMAWAAEAEGKTLTEEDLRIKPYVPAAVSIDPDDMPW